MLQKRDSVIRAYITSGSEYGEQGIGVSCCTFVVRNRKEQRLQLLGLKVYTNIGTLII